MLTKVTGCFQFCGVVFLSKNSVHFPKHSKVYENVKITTGCDRKNSLNENKSKVLDLFKTKSLIEP